MCETLKVSKSGYYDWLDRPPCAREQANAELKLRIHEAFKASDDTYGMLRIRAELLDEGIRASRKRIARRIGVASAAGAAFASPPSGTNAGARPPIW
jgi:putative transposase